jgi:hypothetical protein
MSSTRPELCERTHLEEGVDLDGSLGDAGKGALRALASATESSQGAGIAFNVQVVLALELGLEVLQQGIVKVLATQVGVTSRGLDGKDATGDGQERDIESSSSEIENEDVALRLGLSVGGIETVGDGGSRRLVDDAEDVQTGNDACVLGRQALRVVEVSRDCDDGLFDRLAELGLCGLSKLGEDHGRNFGRGENLGLVEVFDLDARGAILVTI